jgi:glycosyltransferase involved in cell wall biosynthesis
MALLTIGIPVYNEFNHLRKTVENIFQLSHDIGYEIELLIVDNFSTDGTRKILESLESKVLNLKLKIIFNSENLGFNSSCDKLIDQSSGDYIWIIGAQDLIYLEGMQAIKKISESKLDYIICNARIRDEKSMRIINESLWGGIESQRFNSLEEFFDSTGGPCQAVSCNIYRVKFVSEYTSRGQITHLWGFIERILDALIENETKTNIAFFDTPFVEMLIESDGWQAQGFENFGKTPTRTYGPFTPVLQLSELYRSKLQNKKNLLKSAAPFRDPLGILRTCVQARAQGLPLSLKMLKRLGKTYGNSLVFVFIVVPILFLPKSICKALVHAHPIVHVVRKVFKIKTF